ncbi:lipoyltransferase 2-like [Homarus americanus]|uniref:Lipoyltransferase 2-like n=1 Tax=Homarus americanus TaxID=6706 RepID=A0A8J5JLJ3_HOMAM|nr:lipoyltransferase 2-like [Homarus americanus]
MASRMASRIVYVSKLGRMRYLPAWDYQKNVAEKVRNNMKTGKEPGHTLLLVEHHPVEVNGRRLSPYKPRGSHNLPRTRPADGIPNLTPQVLQFGYVCALERTVIRTLRWLGINSHTSPHTGVWVGDNKICALDLRWYEHIVPCGIPDKGITSISKELNRDVTIDEVEPHFLKAFSEVFECKVVPADDRDIGPYSCSYSHNKDPASVKESTFTRGGEKPPLKEYGSSKSNVEKSVCRDQSSIVGQCSITAGPHGSRSRGPASLPGGLASLPSVLRPDHFLLLHRGYRCQNCPSRFVSASLRVTKSRAEEFYLEGGIRVTAAATTDILC